MNILSNKKNTVRKIIVGIAIMVMLTGSGGYARAQATPATPAAPAATNNAGSNLSSCLTGSGSGCQALAGNAASTLKNAAALPSAADITNAATGGIISILANIAYWLMSAAGYLLGLVGEVFNWIIVITVFQFAVYFGNSAGMLASWGILRDVGNICILFGFIYIGITIILDINGDASRKALPRLLIFAALMNFSLFAGEAVIDVANVLSGTLYKQAGSTTFSAPSADSSALGGVAGASSATINNVQVGIAGVIMQDTGTGGAFAPKTQPIGDSPHLLAYIGTTIFILIVMAVLLAGTIIFFTRAVLLCILLVISPLGVAALAIPQFQERGRQWWTMLIQNAFFAPMFLLLVFAGLKVMEAAHQSLDPAGSKSLADALAAPSTSTGGVLLVFGLTIGFMIAAFQFARSSSVIGGQFATSFAQKTVTGLAKAPFRVAGGAARVVGRETVSRAALGGAHKYDAWVGSLQNSKNVGARTFGGVLRSTPIDAGIAKGLHDVGHSYDAEKKKRDERTKLTTNAARQHDRIHDLGHALEMDNKTPEQKKSRDEAIEMALQKMSQSEIEQTQYVKKNSKELTDVVRNLSPEKFEGMMNNKELGEGIKSRMVEERFASIKKLANTSYSTKDDFNKGKDEIRKWTNEDLTALAKYDPKTFEVVINRIDDPFSELVDDKGNKVQGTGETSISDDQYNALKNNKALSRNQRDRVNSKTKGGQLITAITQKVEGDEAIKAQNKVIRNLASNMGTSIADQPNFVFKNVEVIKTLDKSKLQNLGSKNKLNDDEKADILKSLKSMGSSGNPKYDEIVKWMKENNRAREVWGDTLSNEKVSSAKPEIPLTPEQKAQIDGLLGNNV